MMRTFEQRTKRLHAGEIEECVHTFIGWPKATRDLCVKIAEQLDTLRSVEETKAVAVIRQPMIHVSRQSPVVKEKKKRRCYGHGCPSNKKAWTEEEFYMLLEEMDDDRRSKSASSIAAAKRLGRTPAACSAQYYLLMSGKKQSSEDGKAADHAG